MEKQPVKKRKTKKPPWVKQVPGKPTVKVHKPSEKKEEGVLKNSSESKASDTR